MDILAALYQAVLLLLGVYLVHQAANFVLRHQSLRCKRADLERRGLCIARDSDDARRARLVRELVHSVAVQLCDGASTELRLSDDLYIGLLSRQGVLARGPLQSLLGDELFGPAHSVLVRALFKLDGGRAAHAAANLIVQTAASHRSTAKADRLSSTVLGEFMLLNPAERDVAATVLGAIAVHAPLSSPIFEQAVFMLGWSCCPTAVRWLMQLVALDELPLPAEFAEPAEPIGMREIVQRASADRSQLLRVRATAAVAAASMCSMVDLAIIKRATADGEADELVDALRAFLSGVVDTSSQVGRLYDPSLAETLRPLVCSRHEPGHSGWLDSLEWRAENLTMMSHSRWKTRERANVHCAVS